MRPDPVLRQIERLDPVADCELVYRLHATRVFPWDTTRALEVALLRTYAVPSVGQLLHETQEFEQRTQKRYDDTVLLLSAIVEHGFASEQGREAVRRINRVHAMFDLDPEDMRYVLSTFVAVPGRWLERWGWRPLAEAEKVGMHAYYDALGARMGVPPLPPSYAETLAWSAAFEKEHFARTPATVAVGTATRELFVQWFRPVPAPVVRTAVHSLLEEDLRACFDFPAAPAAVVRAADLALRARGQVVRRLPPRRGPFAASRSRLVSAAAKRLPLTELGPSGAPLPGASQPR